MRTFAFSPNIIFLSHYTIDISFSQQLQSMFSQHLQLLSFYRIIIVLLQHLQKFFAIKFIDLALFYLARPKILHGNFVYHSLWYGMRTSIHKVTWTKWLVFSHCFSIFWKSRFSRSCCQELLCPMKPQDLHKAYSATCFSLFLSSS